MGEGAEKEHILSLGEVARSDQPAFRWTATAGKDTRLYRASDACLVLLKKAEIFKTVIPTKMLEFMSCAAR